jgi:Septum formation
MTTPSTADVGSGRREVAVGILRVVGGGLAGLGLVGAGYLGTAGQDETVRDEAGQVVEGGELGAFRIRLGDCIDVGDATDIESVQGIPCDQPHEAEVYHAFNLPGSEWPGDAAVDEVAADGCYASFEPFVGEPYETSRYDFRTITPSEASWDEFDDREVLCLVTNYDRTPKQGSARGTAV